MIEQNEDQEDSDESSQDEDLPRYGQVPNYQSIVLQQEQLQLTEYDASHAQVDHICNELELIFQQVMEIVDQLQALKEKTYKSIEEARLEVIKMQEKSNKVLVSVESSEGDTIAKDVLIKRLKTSHSTFNKILQKISKIEITYEDETTKTMTLIEIMAGSKTLKDELTNIKNSGKKLKKLFY